MSAYTTELTDYSETPLTAGSKAAAHGLQIDPKFNSFDGVL